MACEPELLRGSAHFMACGNGIHAQDYKGGVVLQGLESVNNENGAWYLLIRL